MLMLPTTRAWTLAEFERLPNDGNRYELVSGALLVTPAPSPVHEELVEAMRALLQTYVSAQRLGAVRAAHSALRWQGSELQPDLLVREIPSPAPETWEEMPTPILVIEVLSPSTSRGDQEAKRRVYLAAGVAEYWIVDRDTRTTRVVRASVADAVYRERIEWHPEGASEPLRIDVAGLFNAVLGPRASYDYR